MIGSINAHQHLWWSLAKAVDSEGMLRLPVWVRWAGGRGGKVGVLYLDFIWFVIITSFVLIVFFM